jgi:hypothetical protein
MAICVNEDCKDVGTDHGEAPDDKPLTFHPKFLNRRVVSKPEEDIPFPLRGNEDIFDAVDNFDPTPIGLNSIEHKYTTALRKVRQTAIDADCVVTRGIVCDRCNRTVTRSEFSGWYCKTRDCRFYVQRSPDIRRSLSVVDSRDPAVPHEVNDLHKDIIRLEVLTNFPGHTIKIFHLPQGCAIICAEPSATVLEARDGPDDQWRSDIAEAVAGGRSLKRAMTLTRSKLAGMESNHYYTAHEKEYRFGYKIDHKDTSRVKINEDATYKYIHALTQKVLKHLRSCRDFPFLLCEWPEPNELMTVGYWPGQWMRAHVDQHTRPPIATYSLGSGEIFCVIPHKDAYYDRTYTGDLDQPDAPAAGTHLAREFQGS